MLGREFAAAKDNNLATFDKNQKKLQLDVIHRSRSHLPRRLMDTVHAKRIYGQVKQRDMAHHMANT